MKRKTKTAKQKSAKSKPSKKASKSTPKPASSKKKVSVSEVKKSSDKLKISTGKVTQTKIKGGRRASSMEELLQNASYEFNVPKHGVVVEGVVTEVTKRTVLVDIGGKTEGMVVDKEYEAAYSLIQGLSVGDRIKAIVVSPETERGQILLSLKREAASRAWEYFTGMMKTGEIVVVRGVEVNRGGLIVQADGMRGFIPSSQFGSSLAGRLEDLVEKPVKAKVIEVDKDKNRLIFSERHVSEAGVLQQKSEALGQIKPGTTLEGVVSSVMPFGAFVTVQVPLKSDSSVLLKASNKKEETIDVDGLVHISEISWEKVGDPKDYVRTGQKVNVKVLSVDKDAGKLNLSMKHLQADPWQGIEKRYTAGSKHQGEVMRVEPFGVFVNFEPGIDGLLHISKIPAGQEPEVGKKIDVYVESVDSEHRRMSLALVHKTTEKLMYK